MQPKGTMRAFTKNICERLQAETETERWQLLLAQKQVIEEYAQIMTRMNELDRQITRLSGEPPPESICPQCHYRRDATVALMPIAEGHTEDAFLNCPDCGLVVPPTG